MSTKRKWDRHKHSKVLYLELDNGLRFKGKSSDVSLGGLFLLVEGGTQSVKDCTEGTLRLMSGEDMHSFPCEIIRRTHDGFALAITERQAGFAMAISHDIFYKMVD